MRLKNENEMLKSLAFLLISDPDGVPYGNNLEISKLDFSIDSLKIIDKFLLLVKKNKTKIGDKEIEKIILRVGAYLGEVIRKKNPKRFVWISYNEGSKLGDFLGKYEKSLLTGYLIYDLENKNFLFVLNKVYNFLSFGKSESIWSFAKLIWEDDYEL